MSTSRPFEGCKTKRKNKYLISKLVTARHGDAELPPNIITMSVVARHGGESPLKISTKTI